MVLWAVRSGGGCIVNLSFNASSYHTLMISACANHRVTAKMDFCPH